MSVINKMLRDLDQRQVASPSDGLPGPVTGSMAGLTSGTAAVGVRDAMPVVGGRRHSKIWRWMLILLLGVFLAALAYWVWTMRSEPQQHALQLVAKPSTLVSTPSALPASTSVSMPIPVAVTASATVPMAMVTVPVASQVIEESVKEPAVAEAKPAVKVLPGVAVPPASLKETLEMAPVKLVPRTRPDASFVPAASKVAAPVMPPVSVSLVPKPNRQAAMELLAQAQAQWNEGGHAQALELLQGVIVRLEQMPAGDAATLAALVREYVRMTMAQGQNGEALAMLERLEPRLAGVADIWALRGNVAQRLGRHQDAAQAYLKSLTLHPEEPRWMLGAAVSLAALGQTGPAAELAEKARVAGALRPDVANYLRQLGVVIRSD
jgi:hypothetical protein